MAELSVLLSALIFVPVAAARSQQPPPPSGASIAALKRDADLACNPLDRLNGDSLYTVLSAKVATLDATVSARALASASDELLVQYFFESFVCRARLAREQILKESAEPDQLDELSIEIFRAFAGMLRAVESGGTTTRRKIVLDSLGQIHLERLLVTYGEGVKLAKIPVVLLNAALPRVNLLQVKATRAGVQVDIPTLLRRVLGDAVKFSAGKVGFATQQAAGNTRLAAEMMRSLIFQYAVGSYPPKALMIPSVAAVYRVGQQLLAEPEPPSQP